MEKMIVGVKGLREYGRSLKALDSAAPKALRVALNSCSTFLIDKARPKIPSVSGAARASMKARSTNNAVRIAVGGRKAPYYPWLDFGGATGKNKTAKRPFYKEGRYLYVTLREENPEFQKIIEKALRDVAESVGLDVS